MDESLNLLAQECIETRREIDELIEQLSKLDSKVTSTLQVDTVVGKIGLLINRYAHMCNAYGLQGGHVNSNGRL